MKTELKSGIEEFDLLVEQFENGDISFVALTSHLWNGGYKAGATDENSYGWISVGFKLPKETGHNFSDKVLIQFTTGDIEIARYDYEFKQWNTKPHSLNITHWQPLPQKLTTSKYEKPDLLKQPDHPGLKEHRNEQE